MEIGRRTLLAAGLVGALASAAARAQQWIDPRSAETDPEMPQWPPRERHRLWPTAPPGAPQRRPVPSWMMFGDKGQKQLWIKGVAEPELNVLRPARPDGSALLCCPGGSYEFLAVQNEGSEPARFFTERGTTVFVLTYRLPGEGWDDRHFVPLQDAQRAMRVIRARASEFGIDARRLGVLGFSAGGHLAADLATSFSRRVYEPVDGADAQSARPAFAGLVYPVATLNPAITHGGSSNNLLGSSASEALRAERSPERNISGDTPPCFLVHPIDDGLVPVENSLEFMAACRKAKVPVEGHIFQKGDHGFGLRLPPDMPASRWPELFALWIRKQDA
jgi:acetyl esterase/lipase